ncbi:transmembrane 87A-like isoform X2 [Brachionus plicatilis]|uniref:Transmembrane 87A-like isoform X2 n=1 Tax=Brachionus plicatilis TaxID=10195 RepID=A0A3M7PM71_BRAPC|nr:transmembrane 87A-like isoform X2 [Brachionus plicatilis]
MIQIFLRTSILVIIYILINLLEVINGYVLPGKFDTELNNEKNEFVVPNRGFYNNTEIQIKITCKPANVKVKIGWLLRHSECIDEFYIKEDKIPDNIFTNIFNKPNLALKPYKKVKFIKQNMTEFHCEDVSYIIDLYTGVNPPIQIENVDSNLNIPDIEIENKASSRVKREANSTENPSKHKHTEFDSIAHTWQDGVYLFVLNTQSVDNKEYSLKITVSLKYKNGYLSANDWPFLPFYSVMCVIYSLFAIYWFAISFLYWRDLLRVQVWIGGVIILGLMEKAAYLAEYDSVNRNGYTLQFGIIVAEVISCFKRSLARMLVIIVSLGFGIVKPRLGPMMQKIVTVGALYFVFSLIDGIFRILDRKEDIDSKGIFAGVPLLFIDVSICYWILSNLQQTMRNLRVRRNIPKLTLFRHFTNTLIFCVIASTVFILWSLVRHRFVDCLRDWKELWLDEGFWHILFSFILLIIIILWRPSNNSQRFAFSPLLDEDDDDDYDQEMETEIFDSVKMRNTKLNESSGKKEQKNQNQSIEDDLKWVEENVPTTLTEAALPGLVDSEEEIANTKFEISKMD